MDPPSVAWPAQASDAAPAGYMGAHDGSWILGRGRRQLRIEPDFEGSAGRNEGGGTSAGRVGVSFDGSASRAAPWRASRARDSHGAEAPCGSKASGRSTGQLKGGLVDKPRSQQCLSLSDVVGVVRPWHGEGSETRRACRTPATAARTKTRAAKRASTCTERGGDGPAYGRTRQGHASRPKTLRARKAPTSTSRPKTPTGRIAPTMACACAEQRTLAARSMAWRSSGAAASKACTPRGPTGRSLSGGVHAQKYSGR